MAVAAFACPHRTTPATSSPPRLTSSRRRSPRWRSGRRPVGATGFLKQGGSYYVYANVSADTGNPASGISSVKANVETITSGQTAVALLAGSYTAGGVSYNYRCAALTADAVLVEGAQPHRHRHRRRHQRQHASNGAVTIDNTAPKATDMQSAKGGTTVGLAEENDSITFTFSEPVEPESILAGWTGARPTSSSVSSTTGCSACRPATTPSRSTTRPTPPLCRWGPSTSAAATTPPACCGGTLPLRASGTASKMTMGGNTVTVVFGTYSSTIIVDAGRTTAAGTGTMVWTPAATPYDRAAERDVDPPRDRVRRGGQGVLMRRWIPLVV